MIKIKNVCLALKNQGPFKRFIRNLYKGHIWGLFSKRSHYTESGKNKVKFNTEQTSVKSAIKMGEKLNKHFSSYKCIYCDGYHIGKNRENK